MIVLQDNDVVKAVTIIKSEARTGTNSHPYEVRSAMERSS